MPTLGRLTKIDLHSTWPGEATDFTPWLAREENLAILSEAIGLDLELAGRNSALAPFALTSSAAKQKPMSVC